MIDKYILNLKRNLPAEHLCWKHETHYGKDRADKITYEKLFSYDDITKAMQGEPNREYAFQRILYRLQNKIESNE